MLLCSVTPKGFKGDNVWRNGILFQSDNYQLYSTTDRSLQSNNSAYYDQENFYVKLFLFEGWLYWWQW